jgi:hypothetical protein
MLPSFELYQPLDELEKRLLADLAGRSLTMNQIYERHSVNKPFTKKNYKQALQALYARGAIEAQPKPRLGTFADRSSVSFPTDAT